MEWRDAGQVAAGLFVLAVLWWTAYRNQTAGRRLLRADKTLWTAPRWLVAVCGNPGADGRLVFAYALAQVMAMGSAVLVVAVFPWIDVPARTWLYPRLFLGCLVLAGGLLIFRDLWAWVGKRWDRPGR